MNGPRRELPAIHSSEHMDRLLAGITDDTRLYFEAVRRETEEILKEELAQKIGRPAVEGSQGNDEKRSRQ